MLKKLLIFLILAPLAGACYLAYQRYLQNPPGTLPTPYVLAPLEAAIEVDAPILIVGDRMGARFALFKENLSLELSQGLSKPLKVASLATAGFGLHRTLQQLDSLAKWPKVILYVGGSEEFAEDRFTRQQIPTLRENLRRYQDDEWRTLLMLLPEAGRLLYTPFQRLALPATPAPPPADRGEDEWPVRQELTYELFRIELQRLFEEARRHDSLLIVVTSPANLDVAPKRTCQIARDPASDAELAAIREMIKKQDTKSAYQRAQKLAQEGLGHAEAFFVAGQLALRLGKREEARDFIHKAQAFDCVPWRANEVTNSILRAKAQEERVPLYDFAAQVERDWGENTTFFDSLYPQDLYYQRGTQALALVLKRLLKI